MDIKSVAGQILSSALSPTQLASQRAIEPSPETIATLREAINGVHDAPGNNTAFDGPHAPAAIAAERFEGVPATLTPGNAILDSMEKMSAGFDKSIENIDRATAAMGSHEGLGAGQLLAAQFQLMKVTVQHDMMSKVVGKTTQSLDTFLKNQ